MNCESRFANEYESAWPPCTIDASAFRSDEMGPKTCPGTTLAVSDHIGCLLDRLVELLSLPKILHDELCVIEKLGELTGEHARLRPLRRLEGHGK